MRRGGRTRTAHQAHHGPGQPGTGQEAVLWPGTGGRCLREEDPPGSPGDAERPGSPNRAVGHGRFRDKTALMFLRHCLAAVFLLVVMLPGCASLVQAPRITLKDASVAGLDTSGIDVEFLLGITNPNSFDLTLLNYTFDLRVLARTLSSGGKQETI